MYKTTPSDSKNKFTNPRNFLVNLIIENKILGTKEKA
jgi:hypothetical protein